MVGIFFVTNGHYHKINLAAITTKNRRKNVFILKLVVSSKNDSLESKCSNALPRKKGKNLHWFLVVVILLNQEKIIAGFFQKM